MKRDNLIHMLEFSVLAENTVLIFKVYIGPFAEYILRLSNLTL